jgi:hypothetical protein
MLAIRPVGFGLGLRRAFLSTARLSRACGTRDFGPALPSVRGNPPLYTLLYLTRCVPFFEAYREHPLQIHPRHTNNAPRLVQRCFFYALGSKKQKTKRKTVPRRRAMEVPAGNWACGGDQRKKVEPDATPLSPWGWANRQMDPTAADFVLFAHLIPCCQHFVADSEPKVAFEAAMNARKARFGAHDRYSRP